MRLSTLPLLILPACSAVPPAVQQACSEPIEAFETACADANVIGKNDNAELYRALAEVKECAGSQIRAVCSDDGYGKGVTWSWNVNENN